MTTAEAPAQVAQFKIVVCGTCDVVFRAHPGRPSCPVCGGDPDQVLIEGSIETSSEEAPPSTEGAAAAAAEAAAEEPLPVGSSDRAPVPGTQEAAAAEEVPAGGRSKKPSSRRKHI